MAGFLSVPVDLIVLCMEGFALNVVYLLIVYHLWQVFVIVVGRHKHDGRTFKLYLNAVVLIAVRWQKLPK